MFPKGKQIECPACRSKGKRTLLLNGAYVEIGFITGRCPDKNCNALIYIGVSSSGRVQTHIVKEKSRTPV